MPLYDPPTVIQYDIADGDPRDYGYRAWTSSPPLASASLAPTTGVQNFSKIWVPRSFTLTTISVSVATVGATLTSGANNVAVYNSSGTQIATTVDQSANWTSTGLKAIATTASVAIVGGPGVFVWAGLKSTGTTPAAFSRFAPATVALTNANQTTANFRAFTNGTSTSTLMPASITLGSSTSSLTVFWFALS